MHGEWNQSIVDLRYVDDKFKYAKSGLVEIFSIIFDAWAKPTEPQKNVVTEVL